MLHRVSERIHSTVASRADAAPGVHFDALATGNTGLDRRQGGGHTRWRQENRLTEHPCQNELASEDAGVVVVATDSHQEAGLRKQTERLLADLAGDCARAVAHAQRIAVERG